MFSHNSWIHVWVVGEVYVCCALALMLFRLVAKQRVRPVQAPAYARCGDGDAGGVGEEGGGDLLLQPLVGLEEVGRVVSPSKHGNQRKGQVHETHGVGDEQSLITHRQHGHKHGGGRVRTPYYG